MSSNTPFLKDLDTSFVNLWSLLRKLSQQGFVGRVHVELQDYAADVFLDGSRTPMVREIDRAANTEVIEPGALHRVVLRARETPGLINVFAGADEASVPQPAVAIADKETSPGVPDAEDSEFPIETPQPIAETVSDVPVSEPPVAPNELIAAPIEVNAPPTQTNEDVYRSGSYQEWPAILGVSGELIAAIERGVKAVGGDFAELFKAVRLELADDYVFLDPIAETLRYENGALTLKSEPDVSVFVAGLSEALRRIINLVAVGDRARRVRERIALEMLPVARRRNDVLERCGLRAQLDRIAGTIVI